MTKRVDANLFAPLAPPCFSTRDSWLSYIEGHIDAERSRRHDGVQGPLIFAAGQPVAFNYRFAFCTDCDPKHAERMHAKGKCQPGYLTQLERSQRERTQAG